MDRLQRYYAHTAWTPADPLAGLDSAQRRAILVMPSTFHERLRMAPWRTIEKRRAAMLDIIAERRLLYDLMYERQQAPASPQQPTPTGSPAAPQLDASKPLSPYYAYRIDVHHHAMREMAERRIAEDRHELSTNPSAQADLAQREMRRKALLEIELERRRLDLKELAVRSGLSDGLASSREDVRSDAPASLPTPRPRSAETRRKRGPKM